MLNFNNSWNNILSEEFEKEYYKSMIHYLDKEYNNFKIFPQKENIFKALEYTDFEDIKVVILGQDPYIKFGQAHGLAFSVQRDIKIPPSLLNIYKELNNDLDFKIPKHGFLFDWAKEGVLLLNSVLTVRENKSNSHKNIGWEKFTDKIIEKINSKNTPVVFMLWGNNAINKKNLIKNENFYILTAPHPSPLSVYKGFFGCNHFSKANNFFKKNNIKPIKWDIKE